MSFTKKPERKPVKKPAFRSAPVASGTLLRTLLVGLLAIAGAAWALARHYTHTLPPMRVPVAPREAPTFDIDAGEIPVPEWAEPDAR
jgi:hypothetical protein